MSLEESEKVLRCRILQHSASLSDSIPCRTPSEPLNIKGTLKEPLKNQCIGVTQGTLFEFNNLFYGMNITIHVPKCFSPLFPEQFITLQFYKGATLLSELEKILPTNQNTEFSSAVV